MMNFSPSQPMGARLRLGRVIASQNALGETLREEFSQVLGMSAAALMILLPVIEEFSLHLMAEMLRATRNRQMTPSPPGNQIMSVRP